MTEQSLRAHEYESDVSTRVQETLVGIRAVQAFGQEAFESERFRDKAGASLQAHLRLTVIQTAAQSIVGLVLAAMVTMTTARGCPRKGRSCSAPAVGCIGARSAEGFSARAFISADVSFRDRLGAVARLFVTPDFREAILPLLSSGALFGRLYRDRLLASLHWRKVFLWKLAVIC